jgi:hypothetical protein
MALNGNFNLILARCVLSMRNLLRLRRSVDWITEALLSCLTGLTDFCRRRKRGEGIDIEVLIEVKTEELRR